MGLLSLLLHGSPALALDPAQDDAGRPRPEVVIRSVVAGKASYAPEPDLQLPERTTSLRIDYAAEGVAATDGVNFHYRLEGVDESWQDAGTRRQAFYTNLGSGAYRFQVMASGGHGSWGKAGATLDFSIRPTFFQTGWFHVLSWIAGFIFLWMMYLVRLRQMTLRLRARLEERYGERERIARELHDTLLQGVQGLILRFHALANRSADPLMRELIEQTLDHADTVLEEGRDRVRALRDLAHPVDDLAAGLTALGREMAEIHNVSFRVQQLRNSRELDPIVRDEIYQVGREALFNAFQHAAAHSIEVELAYDPRELRLRVRDSGKGIDAEVLRTGNRPGHWGLRGMRERAGKIAGTLDIWSREGSGTEVELRVPAATAYRGRATRAWLLRLAGKAVAMDAIP